jgi:hypothetical protein
MPTSSTFATSVFTSSPFSASPFSASPLATTGRLELLRSQRFSHHALRSQLAVATVLRSQRHPCQLTGR